MNIYLKKKVWIIIRKKRQNFKFKFVLMITINFFKLKYILVLANFVLLIQISSSYIKWYITYLKVSVTAFALSRSKLQSTEGGGWVVYYDLLCHRYSMRSRNYPLFVRHRRKFQQLSRNLRYGGSSSYPKLWRQCTGVC